MNGGKPTGKDNIPAEVIKHGDPAMVKVLTMLCQKIWETKEWPKEWTQSLISPLLKKGNLPLRQNYHTISLISQQGNESSLTDSNQR